MNHERLTLIRPYESRPSGVGFDLVPRRMTLRAQRVLKGLHIDEPDSAVFAAAHVRIENLDVWSGFVSFDRSALPGCTCPSARVIKHRDVVFTHNELRFRVRHRLGHFQFDQTRNHDGVACPSWAVLEIESDTPRPPDGFDDAIATWVDLVSFATRQACALTAFTLVHAEPRQTGVPRMTELGDGTHALRPTTVEREQKAQVYALWTVTPDPESARPVSLKDFTFLVEDRPLADWYNAWASLPAGCRPGINALLSLTYGRNTFVNSDFFAVASAAESIYRVYGDKAKPIDSAEFKRTLKAATKDLDETWAQRIKSAVRNEPEYVDKLKSLTALPDQQATATVIPDRDRWAREFKDARNGAAHALSRADVGAVHLHRLTQQTRTLLELVLMQKIGVAAEAQRMHALTNGAG
ncbi:HEPN domain-containing protein [Tsukamurella soli]|uniref:HEPN domain-containing protein n=1 Tax=Tsukamurella soli TaxID=644556 RepID=UPI0031EE1BCB